MRVSATYTNVLLINKYATYQSYPSDKDDNKFVDCAIASNAEYIVTNDTHFNVLKEIDWPKVMALTIKEFVNQTATE